MHTKKVTTERDSTLTTSNRYNILTIESALSHNNINVDSIQEGCSVRNVCGQKRPQMHMNMKNRVSQTLKIFSTNGAGILG